MKKKSEKILFYIILSLGLLIVVNFASGIVLQKLTKQDFVTKQQNLASLPNFKNNPDEIKQIYQDYVHSSYQYEPFVEWKRKPFQSKTLNIDSAGFRIQVFDKTKLNPINPKVYFFGGSNLWGSGVDDNHTIPALWSQLNPDYEAHNVSETGFNSRQNLETLINLLTENKKIDIAIFYEGMNDIGGVYNRAKPIHAHQHDLGYLEKISNPIPIWSRVFYVNTKALIEHFTNNHKDAEMAEKECDDVKTHLISQESIKTWEIAKTLVEKQGGKFILIVQPTAYIGTPNVKHLNNLPKVGGEGFKCVYPVYQNYCKQEKNQHWAFDFTDIFNGNEIYYFDVAHVSANGNQKVAARIDSILKVEQVLTPDGKK